MSSPHLDKIRAGSICSTLPRVPESPSFQVCVRLVCTTLEPRSGELWPNVITQHHHPPDLLLLSISPLRHSRVCALEMAQLLRDPSNRCGIWKCWKQAWFGCYWGCLAYVLEHRIKATGLEQNPPSEGERESRCPYCLLAPELALEAALSGCLVNPCWAFCLGCWFSRGKLYFGICFS